MRRGFAFASFACLLLATPVFGQADAPKPPPKPSFDCARATGRVEQVICKSYPLAALDVQEAALLRRARRAATTPDAVDAEQDVWLDLRNGCRNEACIADAYQGRIEELHRWVN
jgi:uncharacterized protein